MPTKTKSAPRTAKSAAPAKTAKPAKAKAAAPKAKAPRARMTLAETMALLEKAGSAQTRKTYLRHGATEPLFGVSFATFKQLVMRIGVDHELALQLWDTGNLDARILAIKVADPARMTPGDLDRWARTPLGQFCGDYVALLTAEGPHASAKAAKWLASKDAAEGTVAWRLVASLAMRDAATPETWFAERLREIETTIHEAPNSQRLAMNHALISIGGRSPALRDAALAAAKRIGHVEIDHGDTSCKTPDPKSYVEKMWAHAKAKGFATPSVQEQARASPRIRC